MKITVDIPDSDYHFLERVAEADKEKVADSTVEREILAAVGCYIADFVRSHPGFAKCPYFSILLGRMDPQLRMQCIMEGNWLSLEDEFIQRYSYLHYMKYGEDFRVEVNGEIYPRK